jgi:hypothetical protein
MPRQQVGGNAVQPSDERSTLPLETPDRGQRLMKDFCCQILRLLASTDAAGKVWSSCAAEGERLRVKTHFCEMQEEAASGYWLVAGYQSSALITSNY